MTVHIPLSLRKIVIERAAGRCEYCLFPQLYAIRKFEPDHIVPVQHGGQTESSNMACACHRCNRNKGPNVGSYDPLTNLLTPFYNPSIHRWHEHFEMHDAEILPLTPEARVTVKILRLNDDERLIERSRLITLGVF